VAVRTAEVWCGDIPNEQLGTRRSPMSFAGSMRLLITERGRRRKAAGCVAVRGHVGCRRARLPGSWSTSYGGVGVAGRWRRTEGGSVGARACDCGDDDGPAWPHDDCRLAAGNPSLSEEPWELFGSLMWLFASRPGHAHTFLTWWAQLGSNQW